MLLLALAPGDLFQSPERTSSQMPPPGEARDHVPFHFLLLLRIHLFSITLRPPVIVPLRTRFYQVARL